MRTTLSIADEVLRELKQLASARGTSLTKVANEVLRVGLEAIMRPARPRRRYTESPVALGEPAIDLTKALALAAALEDEEVVRKLQLRK